MKSDEGIDLTDDEERVNQLVIERGWILEKLTDANNPEFAVYVIRDEDGEPIANDAGVRPGSGAVTAAFDLEDLEAFLSRRRLN